MIGRIPLLGAVGPILADSAAAHWLILMQVSDILRACPFTVRVSIFGLFSRHQHDFGIQTILTEY